MVDKNKATRVLEEYIDNKYGTNNTNYNGDTSTPNSGADVSEVVQNLLTGLMENLSEDDKKQLDIAVKTFIDEMVEIWEEVKAGLLEHSKALKNDKGDK